MKTLTLAAAFSNTMKALTFFAAAFTSYENAFIPAAASFKNENVFIFRSALTSQNLYVNKVLCKTINTYWTYFFTSQKVVKMIKNPLKVVKFKEKR